MSATEIKINGILSSPRLGFTQTWHCIHNAMAGIPVASYRGCWWERGIEEHLQKSIKDGTDFVVTFDYDSIFTAAHFETLLECIVGNDDIDVISSWQMRRGYGTSLMSFSDKPMERREVDIYTPLRVKSAHFGLTIIRLSSMKDVPAPWLWNIPNGCQEIILPNGNRAIEMLPDCGGWGDAKEGISPKVDADVYFWNQLEKAGKKAYVLPCVKIGHLEELVAAPDEKTGMSQHYYPSDYETSNPHPVKVNPRKGKDEKPE